MVALAEAVDGLVDERIDSWSGAALAEDLSGLRRQIDRLEAEFARRLRQFDDRGGFRDDGAVSTVSWLRHRCALPAGAAAQRLEIARQLPVMPQAEAPFRNGEIGFHHAAVLARLVADVGPDAARLAGETMVEAALRLDPGRLRLVARHLRHVVDPDGALAQAIHDHQRRYLHLSETFDGVYALDGLLDAEGGAALRTALDSLCAPVPDDNRSGSERRADALVELAVRQMRGGELPSAHGQRPHLVLTASAQALMRDHVPAAPELVFAGPVPFETARRLACDASVSQVVVDETGVPMSSGRARRTISAPLRRALVVRDGGCRFPGCDRPSAWTDAHHIEHWADAGETDVPNLVLLCRIHHRTVHEGGWSIVASGDGSFTARPP